MKTWKRGLASLLAAVMLVSALPAALADEPEAAPEEVRSEESAKPEKQPESPEIPEEDPEASPEDPEVPEEDPEASPEDPEVPEEDPEASPEDPEVPEEDPEASPEEPGNEPEEAWPELGVWVDGKYIPAWPDTSSTLSLLPLRERRYTLNLEGLLPAELKVLGLGDIVEKLTAPGGDEEQLPDPEKKPAVWMRWGYYDEEGEYHSGRDDDYAIIGIDGVLDLSVYTQYSREYYLEFIAGTADQMNPDNLRYIVRVSTSRFDMGSLLDMNAEGEPVILDKYYHDAESLYNSGVQKANYFSCTMNSDTWNGKDRFPLRMAASNNLEGEFPGVTLELREGYHKDLTAALAARDVTRQAASYGLENNYAGSTTEITQQPAVTAIFFRGTKAITAVPFYIWAYLSGDRLDIEGFYTESGQNALEENDWDDYDRDPASGVYVYSYRLKSSDLPVNGTYYIRTSLRHNGETVSAGSIGSYVKKTVARYCRSEPEAEGMADITGQLFGSGGYGADYSQGVIFTVFLQNGSIIRRGVKLIPGGEDSIRAKGLYVNKSDSWSAESSWEYDEEAKPVQWTALLDTDMHPLNGSYFLKAEYIRGRDAVSAPDYVDKTVEGYFTQAAELEGKEDVTLKLFGEEGVQADYSQGKIFTVLKKNGSFLYLNVRTDPYTPILSDGTYFQIKDVLKKEPQNYRDVYQTYFVESENDGYYEKGYQTVLILNSNGSAVEDEEIVPVFQTGRKVKVYAAHAEEGQIVSGQIQTSGESVIPFTPGQPVQYATASESGVCLQNYWVTFVTQAEKAKLFVNGATNADTTQRGDDGTVRREVFVDEAHDFRHDIFLANLGTEALEGLTVEAKDLKNVKLDSYWTVQTGGEAVTSLAPFTTTESKDPDGNRTQYGELPNIAKLRLLPKEGSEGPVSGTITIRSANGGSETLRLTGVQGEPKITTTALAEGIKYVHYSSVIMTNNMDAADGVVFNWSNNVPGLTLRPNGEIYGVPSEAGEYQVTVTMSYRDYPEYSDTAEFTLVVKDNEDENVEAANTGVYGYALLDRIPDQEGTYESQVFRSEGVFGEFMNVYLDGKPLAAGTDYTAEEGSTRITVQAQVFQNAGRGSHTISAEFRSGGSDSGTMRRTAQNFTLKAGGSTPGGSTPGGSTPGGNTQSGGGSGGGVAKPSKNPNAVPAPSMPSTPSTPSADQGVAFADVTAANWFYDDVRWCYGKGLMIGVTKTTFQPYGQISPATVVVVLSRMANADLNAFADTTDPDIPEGAWYAAQAAWAKGNGLLEEGPFDGSGPMSRGRMAVMLAKYLKGLGIDCTLTGAPVTFTDAAQMTAEENEAFQILYQFGIFKGTGNYTMNVSGFTTRAQFAALLHRLSVFVESRKTEI